MTDTVITPTQQSGPVPQQARRTAIMPDAEAALAELQALLPGQVTGPDDPAWAAPGSAGSSTSHRTRPRSWPCVTSRTSSPP